MKKTTLIIQARTGSLRFKNKILKKLGKYYLIEWIIKRVKKSNVDKIVLATTKNKSDQKLKLICKKEKIHFFAGSEQNVLKRFCDAGSKFNSDIIVRVCADNPFVDPQEINNLIEEFNKNESGDYYFNHRNYKNNSYADGFGAELFRLKLIKKISKLKISNNHKEHVTSYIWDNKSKFKFIPCNTLIKNKYHTVVADINIVSDYDKINNFILQKKIKIFDKSTTIASKLSVYEFEYFLKNLFNFNRSLAGTENRKTLKYIKNVVPIKIKGIKSEKKIYNWKVPLEWKLNNAKLSVNSKKIIDLNSNSLHIPSYSQAINKKINFVDLEKKIFTHKIPSAIPYRTFYYKKDWGICLSKQQLKKLKLKLKKKQHKNVEVEINTSFKKGNMNYGELVIKGKSKKEILISTYICHPSLANDNLSGIILTFLIARYLMAKYDLKWSYRIIFVPETIGSISYIHENLDKLKKINTGFNISCVGGKGNYSVKESWDKGHFINSLAKNILLKEKLNFKVFNYDIHGSDERQYSYHGIGINTFSLFKDKYYDYKEYHSSLDNLNFVKGKQIHQTFQIYKKIFDEMENQSIYISTYKFSEPMLSKFNLYPDIGGSMLPSNKSKKKLDFILWILFKCNGKNTLKQIQENLRIKTKDFAEIIKILKINKLIKHV